MNRPTAIVTGGAGAFGTAIATELHAQGFNVAIADLDNKKAVRTASTLPNARAYCLDVTDEHSVNAGIEEIANDHQSLDVVVNNAGILPSGDSTTTNSSVFDNAIQINLRGPHLITRAAMPFLKESARARVIMIGSRTWLSGGNPAYTASKAGLVGLARSFAQELALTGGTVNVVAPGPVDTNIVVGDRQHISQSFDQWAKQTPMGRNADPQDVAGAVGFFASSKASFITGEVLHVAGGLQLAPKL